MDEQEWGAAFRGAAADAPPAGFDAGDVAAASRRVTRRRRAALAGAGLAVLAVVGVGVAVRAPAPAPVTAQAAPEAPAAPEARAAAPAVAPLGPGSGECADRQDPALRGLVEQALPEVVGAPEALTTQECRPGGQRGLALEVRDGTASGVLSVTYLPPGTPGDGAATASGGTVLVRSVADGSGAAPFAARLDAVTAYLAPRL